MKDIEETIRNHISDVLFDYLGAKINGETIFNIKQRISQELIILTNGDYADLISIEVHNKECSNRINIIPNNLFTLIYLHTGEVPPIMFMKNRGSDRSNFEWNKFKYSFGYDINLDLHLPIIEKI